MPKVAAQPVSPRTDKYGEPAPYIPMLTDPRFSQSVERGLAILACFTPQSQVLGIADIAAELGMSRSTTHRYVLTLTKLGYLKQDSSRKYRLALRVTCLGMSALGSASLQEHAHPMLQEFVRRTGFTASLAVLDGADILLVDWVRGRRRGQRAIDAGKEVGARLPAFCTAAGKLLVARLPAQSLDELIRETALKKRGPNAINTKSALREALALVREESLVASDEELGVSVYSIAAPVRSSREVVAAVALDAHSSIISLADLRERLGPHLISVADNLSARLGYRRADEQPSALSAGGGR